jgi:hypothetical protein
MSLFPANFGALAFGTFFGWSATALPSLRQDKELKIDTSEEDSWISSIMLVSLTIHSL